jgi:hypothetical protein
VQSRLILTYLLESQHVFELGLSVDHIIFDFLASFSHELLENLLSKLREVHVHIWEEYLPVLLQEA